MLTRALINLMRNAQNPYAKICLGILVAISAYHEITTSTVDRTNNSGNNSNDVNAATTNNISFSSANLNQNSNGFGQSSPTLLFSNIFGNSGNGANTNPNNLGRNGTQSTLNTMRDENNPLEKQLKDIGAEFDTPQQYLDPYTFEIMHDPVTLSDKQNYNRKSAEMLIASGDHSPITRDAINPLEVNANIELKAEIENYVKAKVEQHKLDNEAIGEQNAHVGEKRKDRGDDNNGERGHKKQRLN